MASWRTGAGKLHCNFTTVPGGEHRGEVLAGTRVCVCAPTRNDSGIYELVNPEYAYSRVANPTRHAYETCVAALEEGVGAVACASGVSATSKARPSCQPAIRLPASMR